MAKTGRDAACSARTRSLVPWCVDVAVLEASPSAPAALKRRTRLDGTRYLAPKRVNCEINIIII